METKFKKCLKCNEIIGVIGMTLPDKFNEDVIKRNKVFNNGGDWKDADKVSLMKTASLDKRGYCCLCVENNKLNKTSNEEQK